MRHKNTNVKNQKDMLEHQGHMLVLLIVYKRHHIKRPYLGAGKTASGTGGGNAGEGISLGVAGDRGSSGVDEGEGEAAQRSAAGDGEFAANALGEATVDACGLSGCKSVVRNANHTGETYKTHQCKQKWR